MAKRTTKQQAELHSWAVYHIAAKQKFVGTMHDAPDVTNCDRACDRGISGAVK